MIIHIPTGKRFNNRKEAKIYFGSAYYYKIEKRRKIYYYKQYSIRY